MPDIDAGLLERGGLRLSVDGQRATITLDRPDVLNAQKPSMWAALQQIGERLDPDVRVVVVRGSGRAFSAGLDTGMFSPDGIEGEPGFREISSLPAAEGEAIIDGFQQGFVWLMDPSRVTIAAVRATRSAPVSNSRSRVICASPPRTPGSPWPSRPWDWCPT